MRTMLVRLTSLLLLSFGIACTERRPLQPLEATHVNTHQRWEDQEAEEIALWASGEISASRELYLRIQRDLVAIRGTWGDSIPILRQTTFTPLMQFSWISVGIDPGARARIIAGTHLEFDSLNTLFNANATNSDETLGNEIRLTFEPLLHPCELLVAYSKLEGVRYVHGNGMWNCTCRYLYPLQAGDTVHYIFEEGFGMTMPCKCPGARYRYFMTTSQSVDFLGEHQEYLQHSDSLPSWYSVLERVKNRFFNCRDQSYRYIDATPPARVMDLEVIGTQEADSITIRFTAPGDDGMEGYPAWVQVLAAHEPIYDSNWQRVVYRSMTFPLGLSGDNVQIRVAVDPKTANYIAVRVNDGSANWSGVSNYDSCRNIWLDGWTFFTAENSPLPGNTVTTLVEDRLNRLWIGTNSGLAIYDHGQWAVYTPANSPLPDDRVTSLALTDEGVAWIGTRAGLARFDGLKWNTYTSTNSRIPQGDIACLAVSPDGDVWTGYGMAGYGLHRFDGTSWRQVDPWPSPAQGFTILSLLKVENGAMWAGAIEGLHRWEAGEWTFFDPAATESNPRYVTRIFEDQSGGLWCATMTNQLLRRFSNDIQVWQMPKGAVTSLTQTMSGRLWLVAGAVPHVQQDGQWRPIGMNLSGLPSNYCRVVEAEGANTLWIGTADKGLCRWDLKVAKLD